MVSGFHSLVTNPSPTTLYSKVKGEIPQQLLPQAPQARGSNHSSRPTRPSPSWVHSTQLGKFLELQPLRWETLSLQWGASSPGPRWLPAWGGEGGSSGAEEEFVVREWTTRRPLYARGCARGRTALPTPFHGPTWPTPRGGLGDTRETRHPARTPCGDCRPRVPVWGRGRRAGPALRRNAPRHAPARRG